MHSNPLRRSEHELWVRDTNVCSVHTEAELPSDSAENSFSSTKQSLVSVLNLIRVGRGQVAQMAVYSSQPSPAEMEVRMAHDGAPRIPSITSLMSYLDRFAIENSSQDDLAKLLQARRHPPSTLVSQRRLESQR